MYVCLEIRFIFSVLSGAIVLVLGSMAGYKLARMNNKAGKATQLIFMMAMMLPFPVIMIPMASVASSMGITNNLTRISVLNAGFSCSLAVIMYSQSIRGFRQNWMNVRSSMAAAGIVFFRDHFSAFETGYGDFGSAVFYSLLE